MRKETSIASRILYEDNHIIVINKLPSEIVQGDITGDKPLSEIIKSYIAVKYQKPGNVFLGVVHRIDRPVSGAVVFARTSKALTRLNEMIKKKELFKKYWAVVKNKPPEEYGKLIHLIRKNEKQKKSYIVKSATNNSKSAELHYEIIAKSNNYYLLEVVLITGRYHQVRVQMAAIGCPIKGDLKYGFDRSNKDASIHLHAKELSFLHPVKNNKINIVAPVPDENLWVSFENMVSSHNKTISFKK